VLTRELGGHGGDGRGYSEWLADHEPDSEVAEPIWRNELAALRRRPDIDLFVAVDDDDVGPLRQTLDSLQRQVYPHWTLHLTTTASANDRLCKEITGIAAQDSSVVAHPTITETSTAAALNAALTHTTGDWLTVLAPGDLLRPDALLKVATLLDAKSDTQIVYSDHDELDPTGLRSNPVFKPDFSPATLLGKNYLERPIFFRNANVRALGGWTNISHELDEYDFALRILDMNGPTATTAIQHIGHVLLHRRSRPVQASVADKTANAEAEIISAHLSKMDVQADVDSLPSGVGRRIRHRLPSPKPLVSLIMPTRDRADLLEFSVGSILSLTDYTQFELLIIDNGSVEVSTHDLLDEYCLDSRVRVLNYPAEFNYSAINNFAVSQSMGDIIGLLNNDIEVISGDWLQEMVSWAALPYIGCVGAKLYYPDGRLQHGGVIIGIGDNGIAAHSHKYFSKDDVGYGARLAIVPNISAVTGACLLVKKDIYNTVGGLDERLMVAFNEVDFCLKVSELGYRNIMNPFAELIHHESASRGADDTPEKLKRFGREIDLMKTKWENKLRIDPYYSPHLTKIHENFDLDWE
jgi:GT2 family glycosyltransferase